MAELTVATANTYLGSMLKAPDGLAPVADADIVLLQEVDPVADQLEELLIDTNFKLAVFQLGIGQAILYRGTVGLIDTDMTLLQSTPAYQRWALQKFREHPLQTLGRGIVHARFETEIGLVTTLGAHANVPVKPIKRIKYMRQIPDVVASCLDHVVLGGDMNHWPRPWSVDDEMAQATGLQRVDIGSEPTYVSANSKHRWMSRIVNIEGQFDAMYHSRGLISTGEVRDIPSDHRAIVGRFALP